MANKIHTLKIWQEYYSQVISGNKKFEIRNNDRDFQVGDVLILQEYDPDVDSYTGEMVSAKITYITNFGQKENYVVMSIELIDNLKELYKKNC